ncbi:hypothetical protein [Nesterenkonia pannonica]|uniref:hypothetical protein n=1 Tax=Nesterenkonia pannonica TaxID=1548602 RepID=UPI0021646BE1|nr:hypothetical protein [Nesterenkonia pannonica]
MTLPHFEHPGKKLPKIWLVELLRRGLAVQPDGARAPRAQSGGERIGDVAQLRCDVGDLLPRLPVILPRPERASEAVPTETPAFSATSFSRTRRG